MEAKNCKSTKEEVPLLGWSSLTPALITQSNKGQNDTKVGENSDKNGALQGELTDEKGFIPVMGHNKIVNFNDHSFVSSKTTLSIIEEVQTGPEIPDGGWGWVIVVACLLITMIGDGISFSFGLLYVEFLEEFGASKSATSWIGSLFMAVPLLTGPIMSAFVDRYGCRLMTIVGGLISAFGFILSAYVRSISLMYLTFGFIGGLGLGLCYVTAVVPIAYWFDKKRNFAIGLGACGTGVGTFIYSPMSNYLIHEFHWRGTTLILAGTFLNICVCGALMRDPDWLIKEQKTQNSQGKLSKKSSNSGSVSGKSLSEDFPDIKELRRLLKDDKNHEYLLQTLATSLESPRNPDTKTILHRSDINLPTFVQQNEKVPLEVLQQLSANSRLYNVILENYPNLLSCRSISDKGLNKIALNEDDVKSRVHVTFSMKLKKADQATRPTERKKMVHQVSLPVENSECLLPARKTSLDYAFIRPLPHGESMPWLFKHFGMHTHNHFKDIKLHRNTVMYRGAMLNIHKYRLRASSCPNIYRNSMVTLAGEEEHWYDELLDLFKGMIDFSMFLELHFLLMSFSTILLFIWFIVPYFYLVDAMVELNYTDSDASIIISIIGITNTIGMIGLGWAGDKPWTNVTKTYGVCLILCGFACAGLRVFMSSFYVMASIAACFGLFFASTFSFTPIILVELVPLERFTTAYGLNLLCQGIGNLLGPPLAGMLYDITKSWDQSFLQAGFWIVVSGILILIIPLTKNRKIWGSGPLEKDLVNEKGSFA